MNFFRYSYLNCYLCPQSCADHSFLCTSCLRDVGLELLPRNGDMDSEPGLELKALGRYRGHWAKLIKKLKSTARGNVHADARDFLRQLVDRYSACLNPKDFDEVVPVPGHPLRVCSETDLALILATEVARVFKKPVLRRVAQRKTFSNLFRPSQKDQSFNERFHLQLPHIAQRKFRVRRFGVPGRVLLVDDVCTTGSTLEGVAQMLRNQGLEVDQALVLARAL